MSDDATGAKLPPSYPVDAAPEPLLPPRQQALYDLAWGQTENRSRTR